MNARSLSRPETLTAFLALCGACIENRAPAENDQGSAIVAEPDAGGGDGDIDAAIPDGGEVDSGSNVEGTGQDCAGNEPKTPDSCYGFYCGTNYEDIRAETPSTGACGSDMELMMICEGPFPVALADCARRNALSGNFEAAVEACVRGNHSWDPITDSCLDCYIVGARCALDNCLGECVSGDSQACDECRETKGCTPDFYVCASMPNPQ
jgi:hypothetical protein